MKKILLVLVVILAMSFNVCASEKFTKEDIQKKVPMKIDGFQFIDDLGLYEIVSGKNVFYMSNNFKYVIVGNVIDLQTQKNITAARMPMPSKVDFDSIKDSAIKVGNGKKEIAVFTDPDCPYCKKFHKEIDTLVKNDYTVYVFLFPLEALHPSAKKKAEKVWCSANNDAGRFKALTIAMSDGIVKDAVCKTPIAKINTFASDHHINATPTLILSDKSLFSGFATADKIIQVESLKKQ